MAISACTPQWLSVVQESYSKDARAQQLLIELAVTPTAVPSFTLVNGIIRFKQRVWIGDDTTLHHQILEALHTSAIGGHSGFLVTYRKLKQLFAWKWMKTRAKTFVQSC
jgi:hypothetical protein